MHKGHSFTTLRDIESKRSSWVGDISAILEEKSKLESKVSEKQLKSHLSEVIEKRKMKLAGEVHEFYTKVREALN